MARVFLVRHGRTSLNAAGVLRGRLDPPLDVLGQAQAARLGRVLSLKSLVVVVSSPLMRAVQTADAIGERAGCGVEIDPRLADRDYGPWAGSAPDVLVSRWGSVDDAPDVEPLDQVLARSWEALGAAAQEAGDGAVAVVAHDAVNRLLLASAAGNLGDAARLPQDTGCYNVLDHRDGVWTVRGVNIVPDEDSPPSTRDDVALHDPGAPGAAARLRTPIQRDQ